MATKYFLINYSSNRKTIETIGKRFPQFDIKASFT